MQAKVSTDSTTPSWWTDSNLLSLPPRELHPDGKNGAVACAVLSETGQQLAFAEGRTGLVNELARHCTSPISEWHFVSRPELIQADSRAMASLISARCASSRPGRPEEWSCIKQDNSLEYLLYIAPGLRWFEDHFPDNPILPGVVQVHWAIRMGAELGFDARQFVALPRVKFTAVIVPDSMVKLSLSRVGTKLRFSYHSHSGAHSVGTASFSERVV